MSKHCLNCMKYKLKIHINQLICDPNECQLDMYPDLIFFPMLDPDSNQYQELDLDPNQQIELDPDLCQRGQNLDLNPDKSQIGMEQDLQQVLDPASFPCLEQIQILTNAKSWI